MKKVIFTAIVGLLFVNGIWAQYGALPFLTEQIGARPIAIGGAYVGVADGPETAFYNISGSAFFEQYKAFASLVQLSIPSESDDSDQNSTAISIFAPVESLDGVIGLNLYYKDYGTSAQTNTEGDEVSSFSIYEMSIGATYAFKFQENLSLGFGVKYIYSHLFTESTGNAFALDVGSIYFYDHMMSETMKARLTVGLSLHNFGPKISYQDEDQSDDLPWLGRVGVSYKIDMTKIQSSMLFTTQLDKDLTPMTKISENYTYRFGGEYTFHETVFARCGYSYDTYDENDVFNWGFGFSHYNIRIDYARDSSNTLASGTDVFSIGYSF